MPSLHIIGLGCVRTQQTTDQTFLRFRIDGRTVHETDPRRFADGTSRVMNERVDFGWNDELEVQVREQDASGSDQLGRFTVDRAWRNLGEWQQQVAWRHAHYVVTFEVTEGTTRILPYTIELLSLECRNAQEASDRPYLEINGERVWGPVRMDDHDPSSIQTLSVTRPFHRNVMVDLWEEDAGGPDHFGKMTLLLPTVQEQAPRGVQTYTFRADSGIVGDARYVLRYDLHH